MRRLLWRKLADIEATLRTAGSSPARRGRWRAERAGGGQELPRYSAAVTCGAGCVSEAAGVSIP